METRLGAVVGEVPDFKKLKYAGLAICALCKVLSEC